PLGHSQEPTTAGASSASLAQPTLSRPAIEPGQSATVLTDGRWLLIGGTAHPGELRVFDPARSTTTDLPIQLAEPRSGHTATLMPDGTVLVVGGKTTNGWVTIDAEQFDPNTGSLVSLGDIGLEARAEHAATVLSSGRLLVLGGVGPD